MHLVVIVCIFQIMSFLCNLWGKTELNFLCSLFKTQMNTLNSYSEKWASSLFLNLHNRGNKGVFFYLVIFIECRIRIVNIIFTISNIWDIWPISTHSRIRAAFSQCSPCKETDPAKQPYRTTHGGASWALTGQKNTTQKHISYCQLTCL